MSENEVDKSTSSESEHPQQDAAHTAAQQQTSFEPIGAAASKQPSGSQKPPVWMWIGLGVLTITALLVVFVLPSVVQEYELPLERRVATPVATPAPSEPEGPVVSPFEEAQRALQRKEAQDILAMLLEHQAELDGLDVESWAEAPYATALEQASIGDEYYRTQDFISASTAYGESRDQLAALLDSTTQVLNDTLAEGQQALAMADSALAEDKFSLALLLGPDNEEAQIGLNRARSLDAVQDLLNQATELVESGDLEQAREIYREASGLDTHNEIAPQQIDLLSEQILANEFNGVMSSGYTFLEQGDPQQAIAAFERAAAMGVNEQQARAAILQTETEVANAEIAAARELIAEAEQNEQWQDVLAAYDSILAIDSNLTFAIEGRDYASKRAQLNQLLVDAIDNPERFADDGVYQQTVDVYFTGRNLEEAGPVLQGQLDELQVLLEDSQVPRSVTLISDNLTEVTVLRTGELGLFEQTTLSLKPGNYVAVGRRAGYREVRQEFTVGFGETPEQVVVRCEERVATSR